MASRRVPDPIIILGAPRSGTTYLNTVLNEHPDIFITHETRIFVWLYKSMVAGMNNPQWFLSHKDRFEPFMRERLMSVVEDFYEELRPNVKYWGDKNPHYASPNHDGTLQMIRDIYPGSKFIHCYRDGRDVVASLLRKRFPNGGKWADFELAHSVWNGHIELGHAFGDQVSDDRFHEIKYEDFITADTRNARSLFEFLGIDFHPKVEEFCTQQEKERTPLSGPTTSLQSSGEHASWESLMSEEQRAKSLDLLRDNLVRFGYDVD